MEWTQDKPTQVGWYWYQPGTGEVEVVEVVAVNNRLVVFGEYDDIEQYPGYWYGPLEAPPFAQ